MGLGETLAILSALAWSAGVIIYKRLGETLAPTRLNLMKNLLVLGFLLLGERLGPLQLVGFALVSSGVLVVGMPSVQEPAERRAQRLGLLLGVSSIALMAVAIVLVKRILEAQPLIWMVALRLAGGIGGLLLLFAWRRESPLPARAERAQIRWPIVLLGAFVGQYLSMVFWLGGYKYAPASVAAILNETTSIFIVVLAALFLHEPLNRRKLLGVALTLSGVACMLLA